MAPRRGAEKSKTCQHRILVQTLWMKHAVGRKNLTLAPNCGAKKFVKMFETPFQSGIRGRTRIPTPFLSMKKSKCQPARVLPASREEPGVRELAVRPTQSDLELTRSSTGSSTDSTSSTRSNSTGNDNRSSPRTSRSSTSIRKTSRASSRSSTPIRQRSSTSRTRTRSRDRASSSQGSAR